jgi:putative phosphoesterase
MTAMRIGILSDSHNNINNLGAALRLLDREGIQTVICCGDLVDAGCVPLFAGLELHLVEGNMEPDPAALSQAVQHLGNGGTFGLEYDATLQGKRLLALHGHLDDRLRDALHSGLYDYVFHGHTHRRRDERIGATRVINPGALGGIRHESRSIAILDLARDDLRVIEIEV